jgi:PBSX family phage terminase large subunit
MPESGVSDYDGIILDGSIRAGKTLPESVSYIDWGMATYNGENLGMAGKTLGALRRNVIGPLKRVLPGRGYNVKDNRSAEEPHLAITKGRKTNYFYLFGGNNERSQDPVLGFTGGGFYFDQVELMPRSFVETAEGRCSLEDAKLWYNCNPQGSRHWFYLDYLQKLQEKRLLHLHFLMDDNLSLSPKTRARYERRWPKGSVFYSRNILGLWVIAEGAIYPDYQSALVAPEMLPKDFDSYIVTCDYGTTNPFVYLLFGRSNSIWYLIKEFYYDSKKDGIRVNTQQSVELGKLLNGILPASVEVDPSEPGFIEQLRRDYPSLDDKGIIGHAINSVLIGIQNTAQMMYQGRLKISKACTNTIDEMSSYSWDAKATEHGDDAPLKVNDHAMDCLRYAVNRITWDY